MSKKLLNKGSIILDPDIEEKDKVITMLAERMDNEGIITNFEGFMNDIYAREEMDNTVVGFKVAIPHGKSRWIIEARLGFMRLKKEIYWGDEEEYVKYIFLIAVPEGESSKHIEVLAGLSKKILDDNFRENLEKAITEDEVLELINS